MASKTLGQAARKLAQQQWRGLANALTESCPSSSLKQQPVSAVAMRAHSSLGKSSGGLSPLAAESLKEPGAPIQQQQPPKQQQQQQPPKQQQQQQAPDLTDFTKKDLVMLFTCSKCNTRAAKAFSKRSYTHGVVILDCPGCHSKHLIADHLGWFGQKGTVEEFAAAKGNMVVRKLADGTMELTPEDILGQSLLAQQASAEVEGAARSGEQEAAWAAVGEGLGR